MITIIFAAVLSGAIYFFTRTEEPQFIESSQTPVPEVAISSDGTRVISEARVLFQVNDDSVREWMWKESGLCDPSFTQNDILRQSYCNDVSVYIKHTRFNDIVTVRNGDGINILFGIESDMLEPDSALGIYKGTERKSTIHMLTTYYLGNKMHSFSPRHTYFAYTSGCFEARCAIYVLDTESLVNTANFIPEEADAREGYEFIKWLSDNSYQYREGEDVYTRQVNN